jgi:dolichol-phosphate mannosyltransferase
VSGPKLSIIMPALNEKDNIGEAIDNSLEAIKTFGIDGEIIVVNDGSNDETQKITEEKAVRNKNIVRIIKHDKPMGIGASFWDGVDEANGSVIVMIPGDNENDPKETLRYCMLLEHVDIVIPFIFNREARSAFRNILSLAFRFIINTTFLVNFNYTNGTVLYRKSILKELDYRSNSFFFQTDMLVRAVKKGYLFAEVPYRLGTRKKGPSKAISFPSFLQVVKGYIKLVKDYYFSKDGAKFSRFAGDSLTSTRRTSL